MTPETPDLPVSAGSGSAYHGSRKSYWVAILLATFSIAVAWTPDGFIGKRWSADLLTTARRPMPPDDLMVIYLDESSRQNLQQPSQQAWERTVHAQLIDRLRVAGARTIAFDIVFDATPKASSPDDALAAALERHGNVVLAAEIEFVETPFPKTVLHLPEPALRSNAAGMGLTGFLLDSDGVVRSVRHEDRTSDTVPHSLSRVAVDRHLNQQPTVAFPPEVRLNLYHGRTRVRSMSYEAALSPLNDNSVFTNKLILVGGLPAAGFLDDRKDRFPTAWTRFGKGTWPGVDLHAAACGNLMTGRWIRRPSPVAESGVFAVIAAVLGFLICRCDRRKAFAGIILIGALASAGLLAAGLASDVDHSWLVPAGVQAPVALLLAWRFGQRTSKTGVNDAATRAAPAETRTGPGAAPTVTATATAIETTVDRSNVFPTPDLVDLPDLKVLARIGGGTFGEVFLARNPVGHHEAVKVISRGNLQEKEFHALIRFQPISRRHPGLLHVLHVGRLEPGNRLYYTLTLADDLNQVRPEFGDFSTSPVGTASGHPVDFTTYQPACMKSVVDRFGPIQFPGMIRIAIQLADAVAYLHRLKLVHRDIKPANVLLVDGNPVIADISLLTDEASATTFAGTPGYIPLEGPGTQLADLFALGRTLYTLSSGLAVHRFPEFPEGLLAPSLQNEWNRIIETAGHRDAERRHSSALALKSDLQACLEKSL